MDRAMTQKRRQSWYPTACGHAPHMTHSTAPLPAAGSSPLPHAPKSQFHYQIASSKLKNEHSNPNTCPVPVSARSASDEAISTAHPGNIFSKHKADPFYIWRNNMRDKYICENQLSRNRGRSVPQPPSRPEHQQNIEDIMIKTAANKKGRRLILPLKPLLHPRLKRRCINWLSSVDRHRRRHDCHSGRVVSLR